MSGVKHTPGPWVASPHPVRSGLWFVQAHLYGDDIKKSDVCALSNDNREANARLIAAAPDLLEAIQVLVTDCSQIWSEAEFPALKQARAAIARARGEQDGGGE